MKLELVVDIPEMVVRVARALHAKAMEFHNFDHPIQDDWDTVAGRGYWFDQARAAIEAMRTPTVKMIRAGRRKPPELPGSADCDVNPLSEATTLRYQAMIDAAQVAT